MKRKVANPNRGLMWGIMAMAIIVLAVVVVFWMWCFPNGVKTETPQAEYQIVLGSGFRGDSLQLTVNDSLVYCSRVVSDSVEVAVAVPDGENLLMVARPEEDRVSSFDMPPGGGRLMLRKHDGEVEMETF